MPFYLVGMIEATRNGRAFRVFKVDGDGEHVCLGLISKAVLWQLLQGHKVSADICEFRSEKTGEVSDYFLNLGDAP